MKTRIFLASALVVMLAGCSDEMLKNALAPEETAQVSYTPTAKPEWQDKTIFIDFDTTYSWGYGWASGLSGNIRDALEESIVDDKIFHVQDHVTGVHYLYKVGVVIGDANITIAPGTTDLIHSIQATFHIKTYDAHDNLIVSKTRTEQWTAPLFTLAPQSNSQLLTSFAQNAAQDIRKIVYEGFQ